MQSRIYRFGRYRIDPTRHEFWDGEELVPLQLKVFESLVYLIKHRDRSVCRDELISAVWGDPDLNDNILTQIIKRARKAVGDSAARQRAIRTVSHFGYCWVEDVEEVEIDLIRNGHDPAVNVSKADADNHGPVPESTELLVVGTATEIRKRPRLSVWLAPALTLALVAVSAAFWSSETPERPATSPAYGETTLVLPVTVIGDDGDNWVRLGAMEVIAERLRAAGQRVVPSDNAVALARTFNGTNKPDSADVRALAQIAAASLVMNATAEARDDHWLVILNIAHGRERPLLAQGIGPDVINAARAAADRMAVLLGLPLVDRLDASSGEPALERLASQVKAAVLMDRLDEARALLADTGPQSDPRLRFLFADIELRAGNYEQAQTAFEALIDDFPPETDAVLRAKALNGLATAFTRRLDYAAAAPHLEEAANLLEGMNDYEARNTLGAVLMARALFRRILQDDPDAAQADYARARIALKNTGDQLALAKLDGNQAMMYHGLGHHGQAIPLARRAADRLADFGDVQSELRARAVLAMSYHTALDAPSALAEAQRLGELSAHIRDPGLEDAIKLYRIAILHGGGQLTVADELLQQALETPPANRPNPHWPEYSAAWHALDAGQPALAARHAEAALKSFKTEEASPNAASMWLVLLRARLELEQYQAAAETAAAAEDWAGTTVNDPKVAHYLMLLCAEYADSLADIETAEAIYERAWKQAQDRQVPMEILHVAQSYLDFLIHRGELQRAGVIADRVTAWADHNYWASLLQLRLYHALGEIATWRNTLDQTRALAGEREIPPELVEIPARSELAATWRRSMPESP